MNFKRHSREKDPIKNVLGEIVKRGDFYAKKGKLDGDVYVVKSVVPGADYVLMKPSRGPEVYVKRKKLREGEFRQVNPLALATGLEDRAKFIRAFAEEAKVWR